MTAFKTAESPFKADNTALHFTDKTLDQISRLCLTAVEASDQQDRTVHAAAAADALVQHVEPLDRSHLLAEPGHPLDRLLDQARQREVGAATLRDRTLVDQLNDRRGVAVRDAEALEREHQALSLTR